MDRILFVLYILLSDINKIKLEIYLSTQIANSSLFFMSINIKFHFIKSLNSNESIYVNWEKYFYFYLM